MTHPNARATEAELVAKNDADDAMATGPITHDEAREILSRFVNSHFKNKEEHARASIPADPKRDDDIRMAAYIVQNRTLLSRAEQAESDLRRARQDITDEHEAICGALGLHPDTSHADVLNQIEAVRSDARNYPNLQLQRDEARIQRDDARREAEGAKKSLDLALDAGTEAAAALDTLAEFNTAGAWLWSGLDRSRVEFEELEARRQRAALAAARAWTLLHPLIPDTEVRK